MPECPKCGASMFISSDKKRWICPRPTCPYQRSIPHKVLSQAELLEENEQLKETIAKLLKEISHNAPQNA